MGMYDSFYDSDNNDWQTKALGRSLDRYDIGDAVPGPPIGYQMKVLGDTGIAYATIRNGVLHSLPDERDESVPLLDFSGGWLSEGTRHGHQ